MIYPLAAVRKQVVAVCENKDAALGTEVAFECSIAVVGDVISGCWFDELEIVWSVVFERYITGSEFLAEGAVAADGFDRAVGLCLYVGFVSNLPGACVSMDIGSLKEVMGEEPTRSDSYPSPTS